jgi:hypothetical protein
MFLGESDRNDFVRVVDFIRQRTRPESLRMATHIGGVRQLLVAEGWHPELIVVCQSWSDQFSEGEVHELIALCPLARIVCCFGPWCDSDGRTRSIWPLAVRVPVAAAAGRLARELALLENRDAQRRSPVPLTASRSEIFESEFGLSVARGRQSLAVVVFSPDRSWREMIESALRKAGFRIHDRDGAAHSDVIIFDADPWDAARAARLHAIRAAHREAPIVAAVGFPRGTMEAELLEAGADSVWFKLAPLCELVDAVSIETMPAFRRP